MKDWSIRQHLKTKLSRAARHLQQCETLGERLRLRKEFLNDIKRLEKDIKNLLDVVFALDRS